jgi:hypothetical protein
MTIDSFNKNNFEEYEIKEIENNIIMINKLESNDIIISPDPFTPDEEEQEINNTFILEQVKNKLEIIEKNKIDINDFYKKIEFYKSEVILQNLYVRNYVSYKFTPEIIFYAVDFKLGIYDLYMNLTFINTIHWINYIEKSFER